MMKRELKPTTPVKFNNTSEAINYCQELNEYLMIKEVSLNRRLRSLITLPNNIHLKVEVIKPTTSFLRLIKNGTDDDMHINSYWVNNCQDFIEVDFSKKGDWNNCLRIIYSLVSGINRDWHGGIHLFSEPSLTSILNDVVDIEVLKELQDYGNLCYDFRTVFWSFIEDERDKTKRSQIISSLLSTPKT